MGARFVRSNDSNVIVIGAGPYGLAVASHLKAAGIATRVFGEPMGFWRHKMPKGMKLRSPWGASSISDPAKALSLDVYSKAHRIAREEPFPLEDFLGYGRWFQTSAVPDLDHRMVARIEAAADGFRAIATDGEAFFARCVIVAMGLLNQQFRPIAFAAAPPALVTHSSDHDNFDAFGGQSVAVIGRGQSACETAALLHEAGATVEIICRAPIHWLGGGAQAAGWRREGAARLSALLATPSAVGPFPLNWLVGFPNLVRLLPADARAAFNFASQRPGAAGWLWPRLRGVRVTSGVEAVATVQSGERVAVEFGRGSAVFDHVVLATGYRIDIANYAILDDLMSAIACRQGSPLLSPGFESSVPGLFFVGASASWSLGPLMRFIAGTAFAARQVTRAIAAGPQFSPLENNRCLSSEVAA